MNQILATLIREGRAALSRLEAVAKRPDLDGKTLARTIVAVDLFVQKANGLAAKLAAPANGDGQRPARPRSPRR